jgi:cell division initiation protein
MTAEQRAKMIVEEAELKALRVVNDAEQERYHLRQDFVKLTHRQNEVAARLRGFLMSELEILAQFQGDDPVGFIKLVPAGRAGELPPAPQRVLGESTAAEHEPATPVAEAEAAADAPAEPVPHAPSQAHVHEVALPDPEPEHQPPVPDGVAPSPFEALLSRGGHEPAPGWIEDELAPDVVEEDLGQEMLTGEPSAEVTPVAEAPATAPSENGAPLETPPSTDRPLHQLLADRLRGESQGSEPSVWERYTAVPDDAPEAAFGSDGPAPTSDAAHGWSLRSLVTGEPEPEAPATVPADEREKIRRLLEDLD